MSVFVRELPASLAYLVIIAGVVLMAGANPPRWQGVAVCALGLGALTTITIVTGRLRIKGPQELSREETPFLFWLAVCFMLFLTGSAIVYMVSAPLKVIRVLDRRYQKVQLGMHSNEVQMLMNFQARWTTQYLAA
jgi:hypothetical protein